MNDTTKIPVAMVGGGAIAPLHAKHILTSPSCQLVAIIDPFPSGQTLAERLAVAHFKTIADLLSSPTTPPPQIYYITTPSGLHVKLATEVLNQASTTAKVILVEKPLSTDSISGQQLLSLAASHKIIIAAGHHRRLAPSIRAAKQAITSNKIGSITAISGSFTLKKNDSYFDTPWRLSRSAGGGPIWTNFVHDIDLLHFLVDSHVTRVWVVRTVDRRQQRNTGDGVEEGAAIMLSFANGVVGTFIVSDNVVSPYAWEPASGDSPLYPRASGDAIDCFRVFGTKGTLTVPDGQLWTYRQAEEDRDKGLLEDGVEVGWNLPLTREVLDVQEGVPFQLQVESLASIVRGESAPVCPGVDGLAAVKVCEAVVAALDKGDGLPVDIV